MYLQCAEVMYESLAGMNCQLQVSDRFEARVVVPRDDTPSFAEELQDAPINRAIQLERILPATIITHC